MVWCTMGREGGSGLRRSLGGYFLCGTGGNKPESNPGTMELQRFGTLDSINMISSSKDRSLCVLSFDAQKCC